MPNLYQGSNVKVLKDKDFDLKNKRIKNHDGSLGYLKMYADWCPHCQDKVDRWSFLADEFLNSVDNFRVYASNIEEDAPQAAGILGVSTIPSFFEVHEDGSLTKYEGKFSLPDLLGNFCESRNKFCDYKKLCQKKPEFCL